MDLKNVTAESQDRRTALRLDPEQLVRLADALPRDEARLIFGRFAEGLTYPDLARRHRTDARLIRRRVERIAARMQSPEFRFTLVVESRSKWDFAHVNGTDPTGTTIAQGVRVILLAPVASLGAGG